jgi:hypothetical protein
MSSRNGLPQNKKPRSISRASPISCERFENRARHSAIACSTPPADFQIEHPTDRRVGPLLAEVSTLFAAQPQTMRSLLLDAQPLATDPQLKAQINDDLKRLELIGQPLTLHFATLEGKTFDLEQVRGSVVMIVFFAVWSAQSVVALERIRSATSKLPANRCGSSASAWTQRRSPLPPC